MKRQLGNKLYGSIALALLMLLWLLALTWLPSPAPFSHHMLQHIILVTLVSPLLVFMFPSLLCSVALSPLLATLIEFLVVWGWHLPDLHAAAAHSMLVYLLEQSMFLGAGILIWGSVLQPGQAMAGVGGLLLTSMHMTMLGALLILSPRALYLHDAAVESLAASSAMALQDQQMGGMIMLAIGTPIYILGALVLLRRSLKAEVFS
ncbi:cytochrome c oxidase assembly protein [Allohahella sp. A8]|uniref:cytochrome c oxidase assembly protein n=1 Tax=Allohahella sp. A8 TaxID=3141461 RepID=UPI00267A2E5C